MRARAPSAAAAVRHAGWCSWPQPGTCAGVTIRVVTTLLAGSSTFPPAMSPHGLPSSSAMTTIARASLRAWARRCCSCSASAVRSIAHRQSACRVRSPASRVITSVRPARPSDRSRWSSSRSRASTSSRSSLTPQ
ncbi:hypothetical protein [Amycolatopsis tolypomycina]|uniref:hypothetical protein n=1 Tax=Amycolatopsis tolypomycina TaxID=208445 RepID=UPI00339EB8BC